MKEIKKGKKGTDIEHVNDKLPFILVTDMQSSKWAGQLIANVVSKHLTFGVIQVKLSKL